MRVDDDLPRVVAVVLSEMLDLGIETPFATITFVDEAVDEVHNYFGGPCPHPSGLDWSPERASDELTIVGDMFTGVPKLGTAEVWLERFDRDRILRELREAMRTVRGGSA